MKNQDAKLFKTFLYKEEAYTKFIKALEVGGFSESIEEHCKESGRFSALASAFKWGGCGTFNQETYDYWNNLNIKWKKILNLGDVETLAYLTSIEKKKESLSELVNKDIAYFVAFFYWGDYGFGSMFETFDKVYGMAVKFVEKYPPTLNWEDASWEEVAEQWIIDNYKNIKLH